MRRALCLIALALILATPRPAAAIPIVDRSALAAHMRNLAAHLADAYGVMKGWRDEMTAKAKKLDQRTRELIEQRRRLEGQVYGELGAIGKGIPDWKDFTNECRYDVRDTSICDITTVTDRQISRVVNLVADSIQRSLFTGVYAVEREIETLVGRSTSSFVQALHDAGAHPLNELERYHASQAEAASNLDTLAVSLNRLAGDIQTEEQLDSIVSSGRASQIAAEIGVTEASADLEMTRQRIQYLRVSGIDVMDRLHLVRGSQKRASRPLSSF